MIRKPALLAIGAAAALAVAGCGGGGSSTSTSPATGAAPATSGGGGGETLSLSADPNGALKFDKRTLTAKAGTVTIKMANPSSVPHGVAVEGHGVDKDGNVVQRNGTSTVTVKLRPGTYEFYCPVPGHKQAGMEGKLIVK